MLQRLHDGIVALQGYLAAALKILTGADFVGLHAKMDRLIALLEAEPDHPAVLQLKPAPVDPAPALAADADTFHFMQPEAQDAAQPVPPAGNG